MAVWKHRTAFSAAHNLAKPPRVLLRTLAVVVALLWLCPAAPAQISPGALASAHQQLEGVAKCATCHDFGAGTRRFKCLECHTEIQHRLQAQAGFHARAFKPSAGQADCARCHMEHNGRNFTLTRLDRKSFDHTAQTGFVLDGKHREQKCEACHNTRKIPVAARGELKLKDADRSFLGLRRECTSCHEDRHSGRLSADCASCHSQTTWTKPPGFSHAKTSFPLTGLHRSVACQKCHVGPANTAELKPILFKGVAFSGCQSCHTDAHKGAFQEAKFRGSCDTCHTTTGWKNNRPAANFAHNLTKFPLTGKHADETCAKCHKDSDFHRPIRHDRCADCHQDPHKGQFVTRAAGSDCASCHNDTAFKPALFNRDSHRQSAFPLQEKHASLECASCHEPQGKDTVFASGKLLCASCHREPHGKEFAGSPWMNRCDTCHAQSGFESHTFSVARHAQTSFPLTGKHETVTCAGCHRPLTPPAASTKFVVAKLPTPERQFHFDAKQCSTCHSDPHQTKLACDSCHTPEQWNHALPFDHSTTKFPLEAAHKFATCIQCHNTQRRALPVLSKGLPKFSETPVECTGCHADYHGGQFRTAPPEDCSLCHVATRWKSRTFDHERASFALDRRHINVECAKCHKEEKDVDGLRVRIYRGTPSDCVKCH